MPAHCYRMRAFDRDLIRGGHYGQRSCEPHLKAEHMAAPTNAANVKKALANSEPSTHGTKRTFRPVGECPLLGEQRKSDFGAVTSVFDPQATFGAMGISDLVPPARHSNPSPQARFSGPLHQRS